MLNPFRIAALGLALVGVRAVAPAAELAWRELGVPVRGLNWTRMHPGASADGRPSLLISMGQNNGGLFVCDVDLATGHCRQFPVGLAGADFPTASLRSPRSGILYIGSAWTGHLHRYDPARPERGLEDLGAIDAGHVTFPCGIQEAPDGSLYIGGYPEASLTRYEPASGRFTRFGRFDEKEKYLYPLVADDGTVVVQIKTTRYYLIAFDPRTGARRPVGPVLVEPTISGARFEFFQGTDGHLYLDASAGKFRLTAGAALPVETLPPRRRGVPATYKNDYQLPAELPGGMRITPANSEAGFRRLRVTTPGAAPRLLELDWRGGGTNLFLIHQGPDGKIYGSSYLPEHLFRCEPDGSGMVDLGFCSVSQGEAYSMANVGGKLAIASYPGARVSLYDPAVAYHFGEKPESNPRDYGSIDAEHVAYRPHVLWGAPDGKLWVGSAPNYGLSGGPLAWFDPRTGARRTHRTVLEGLSPVCALPLANGAQLLLGFGTEPGSGVQVSRTRGAFVLWDTVRDELIFSGDFGVPELADVCALVPAAEGRVYALSARAPSLVEHHGAQPAPTRIALVDPARRVTVASALLPAVFGGFSEFGYKSLRGDARGRVFGATTKGVYRLKPGTCEAEWLWNSPLPIDVVGPIVGRTLYFASGWRLLSVDLPE